MGTVEDFSRQIEPFCGRNKLAFVLHNVLTKEECQALIERSEKQGYGEALINSGGGRQKRLAEVRNNDRAIIDDADTAEWMWQRVLAVLSHHEEALQQKHQRPCMGTSGGGSNSLRDQLVTWRSMPAVGLNERLRFLRYDPGTFFASHYDGSYRRDDGPRQGERSYVTFQLYLNQGFEGGSTRFVHYRDESQGVDVVPRTGSVLLFEHNLLHEGAVLVAGRKYALRTDVMYTDKGEGREYEHDFPTPGRRGGGWSLWGGFSTTKADSRKSRQQHKQKNSRQTEPLDPSSGTTPNFTTTQANCTTTTTATPSTTTESLTPTETTTATAAPNPAPTKRERILAMMAAKEAEEAEAALDFQQPVGN